MILSMRDGRGGTQATETAFESFGVRLSVDVDDPALIPDVHKRLPPGWVACEDDGLMTRFSVSSQDGHHYEVTRDAAPLGQPAELEVALGILDAHIRMQISQRATQRIFVHAGAVALDERALVLPGRSFAGKTTLVGALIRQGATYFSDEYAVLDDEGRLYPYPKPLSIRERGAKPAPVATRSTETHAADLGAEIGDRALPITLIASTTYVPGARWDPRTVGRADGALLLLSHAVTARNAPGRVLSAVRSAAQGARALEGDRGEAEETAGFLLELLQAR
jgi:hypothetical protein